MKVKELMETNVAACKSRDSLNQAARLMWENDCGLIPVEDPETEKILGVITDRDICMAAYTRGQLLTQIAVGDMMSRETETCRPDDDVSVVHELMRKHQVRRVPVTDGAGRITGIVSLNDLAIGATGRKDKSAQEVARTLAEVCRHRVEART